MNFLHCTGTAEMFPRFVQEWEFVLEKCKADRSRAGEFAEQFIALLGTNYSKSHSCVFYAALLNTRQDYLYEICRKTLCITPSRLIQLKLFLESCRLLSETCLSVKEVALSLGFEDPVYFTRFFKKWGTGGALMIKHIISAPLVFRILAFQVITFLRFCL